MKLTGFSVWTVCCLLAAVFFSLSAFAASPKVDTVYLDSLDLRAQFTAPQQARLGWYRNVALQPAKKIDGTLYSHNFITNAPIAFVAKLPEGKVQFAGAFKVLPKNQAEGKTIFRLHIDGKELWKSPIVKAGDPAVAFDVSFDCGKSNGKKIVFSAWPVDGIPKCTEDQIWYNTVDNEILWLDTRIAVEKTDIAQNAEQAKNSDAAKTAAIQLVNDPVDLDGNALDPMNEAAREYLALEHLILLGMNEKTKRQACHPQATLLPTDRDPLDIILRRTAALADAIKKIADEGELKKESDALNELAKAEKAAPITDQKARRAIFNKVFELRRQIALSNPLLDFDDILFIKRHYNPESEKEGNHMCDQFFGFHSRQGGGLFVLKNAFAKNPQDQKVVDLLAETTIANGRLQGKKLDQTWGYLAPTLSYDGKTVYFAATDATSPRHSYLWTDDNCYHLFKVGIDGKGLTQLTDGAWNDIDPYPLPNGRIVFISERRGGYGRCHARPCPSYTLHSMENDGSDIVCLSPHETNEWSPTVDKNGMIVYTRWDYVDRGFSQAHHPWITYPDGRDPRAIQGNYSEDQRGRPHFETSFKQVPESNRLVGTAQGHHTQYFGSLILLDPNVEDDDTGGDPMAPLKRITPEQRLPEAEIGVHGASPSCYGQPWPISEEFYLCVYDPFATTGKGIYNGHGLYLLDVFGNKILLYRDPNIACQCPYPVCEREVPPVIPHQTLVGIPKSQKTTVVVAKKKELELPKTAVVGVTNVYNTIRPFPDGTKIKELRIVQILPKTTWNCNDPWIGYGAEKSARTVLGTVPVEPDGSARFNMPVDVPFYFQALDENGVAVQSMRSAAYVKPGETLTCQGCHEGRYKTSGNKPGHFPAAFRRKPSNIKEDLPGSKPMNYPTLVQNTLDKHCVECHAKEAKTGKTFPLDRGPAGEHFFTSYKNLRPFVFVFSSNQNKRMDPPITHLPNTGGAYDEFLDARTFPGKFGSQASSLWHLLKKGHYDVKLNKDEYRQLAIWLDNNADFYGNYEFDTLEDQRKGLAVKPTLE